MENAEFFAGWYLAFNVAAFPRKQTRSCHRPRKLPLIKNCGGGRHQSKLTRWMNQVALGHKLENSSAPVTPNLCLKLFQACARGYDT
jgi:hypothetical protein